jgi:hypothetical protein
MIKIHNFRYVTKNEFGLYSIKLNALKKSLTHFRYLDNIEKTGIALGIENDSLFLMECHPQNF